MTIVSTPLLLANAISSSAAVPQSKQIRRLAPLRLIFFIAPRFNDDGTLQSPGRMTVLHNGVLIQNNVELKGSTVNIGKPKYETHTLKQPLMLQDHENPVSYRNIWIREL